MHPAMMHASRPPRTVRLGTPPTSLVERILEPMLHETVAPLAPGCAVWRRPPCSAGAGDGSSSGSGGGGSGGAAGAVFLSLDVQHDASADAGGGECAMDVDDDASTAAAAAVAASLPSAFREHCTTCVAFAHPLRAATTRVMCVLPALPPPPLLAALAAALRPCRGEAHITACCEANQADAVAAARAALCAAGLHAVTVNATESAGYALHTRAADLTAI
jgi:hypothetical protein